MNNMMATIGILAVGGGLSLCDLCGGDSKAAASAQTVRAVGASTVLVGYTATERVTGGVAAAPFKFETVTFKVDGMTCGGCAIGVRKVLTRLPGVSKADVTYKESRAVVIYNPAKVTVQQMADAIATLGYTATVVASPPTG